MPVGVIYGSTSSTRFDVAVADPGLRRLDYVAVRHEENLVLCQVDDVQRLDGLSFDEAMAGTAGHEDRLSASVAVIGYVDATGRVQTPLTPFRAGQEVGWADDTLVTDVLGLEPGNDGALMGTIKGSRIPVRLSMNMLAQKHVSVLAKTGAGKSYTVGVLLEEFLSAGVPLVILDPHGEYNSLRHANTDPDDVERMASLGIKPRSFDDIIHEVAIDTDLNRDATKLRLEGTNLEGQELVDLLGSKLSGGQVGVLYQAIKEAKENLPGHTIEDIIDAVHANKSSAKWNVINALETLQGTGLFHLSGTPLTDLVKPNQCTIVNLKGVAPDIQEVAVTRLTGMLWAARKRGEVPPFLLVCEEAHNFCPERGVGNAISGAIIRTVASEGRKFGMGLVIVSQRPAKIDKNVLSQCNTQFVLKVTNPNDLKAIISSVEGITGKAGDELQRLPIGTALVAGGGLTQPVFADVRPRITRHGGASIDVVGGKRPKQPKSSTKATIRDTTPVRESVAPSRNTAPPATEAPREAPVPRPAAPASPPAAPKPPAAPRRLAKADAPTWSPKDAPAIQRVAERVGLVSTGRDPKATIAFIQRLAIQNGRDPEARAALYAEIGRNICHEDAPHCIACPMAEQCQHHQRAKQERKKSRSPIRRLWR